MAATVEEVLASRNLLSAHPADSYPGVETYRPPGWALIYICPAPGQSFVARGGEHAYAFEAPSGWRAERIVLGGGDRVTLLEHAGEARLGRWRIERAGPAG